VNAMMGCRRSGCAIQSTGACSEGLSPPESCPNFVAKTRADSPSYDGELDVGSSDNQPRDRVHLARGEALTVEEVDEFLRWRPATFVCIVGESQSGKTTLVSSLYERFLDGAFGGFEFTSSRTLLGFERRSHLNRVESGRAKPDTLRTSLQDGLRYFHFAVTRARLSGPRVDLLLSDRSGEVYRSARNTSNVVVTLTEISQADRVVLLLDGGKIIDPFERSGALQSVRQMLRVLVDNSAVGRTSCVQIVTTKVDLLAESPARSEIGPILSAYRERLHQDFSPKLHTLSFYEIAARDPSSKLPLAHGLDVLLNTWTTPMTVAQSTRPPLDLPSEFDRLLQRTPRA